MAAVIPFAVGSLFGAVGGTVVGSAVSGVMTGPSLWTTQLSLRNSPNVLPAIEHLIHLYHQGAYNRNVANEWLNHHGVPYGTGAGTDARKGLWDRVIDYLRPVPTIEKIRAAWKIGDKNPNLVWQEAKRAGLARVPDDSYWLEEWNPITPEQALVLLNRTDISEAQARKILSRNGIDREQDQDQFLRLRYQFPYHGDLIRFAVREVFNPNVVARFNYDDEFPPEFQAWMNKMGMGWKPSDLGYVVPPEHDISWARQYWRAHWEVMSPTQAGQAVHFLRPTMGPLSMSRRPGVPGFTRADFDTMLRIADYPPLIRDWLYGLSFSRLTRRDITRMHQTGTLDADEVREAWLDLGYDTANAQRLTDFTVAYAIQAETRFDRMRIETTIRELFDIGIYGADEFIVAMHRIRLKTPAQQAAFALLPPAEQLAAATANAPVMTLLNSLRLKKDARFAKKTIAAVRKALIKRQISNEDGRQLLEQAGIDNAEITRLLSLWAVEQAVDPKEVTAAQVLRMMTRGAITPNEAAQRLSLMGYRNRDIAIMIAIGSEDRGIKVAREQERLASSQQQVLRAQAAQLSKMQTERSRIIADLNKSASRPAILKFMARGYINTFEAYAALRQRGIFPKDAYLWIRDAWQAKGEANAEEMEKLKAQAEKDSRSNEGTKGGSEELQNGVPQES